MFTVLLLKVAEAGPYKMAAFSAVELALKVLLLTFAVVLGSWEVP